MTGKDIGKKFMFMVMVVILTMLTFGLYPMVQMMYYLKQIAENTNK